MFLKKCDVSRKHQSARLFLDEDHLAVMHNKRPKAVAVHIIRDRFSLQRIPIIYYNAKFGLPVRAGDQDFLDRWPRRDFRAITHFQLHTCGIRLDPIQERGFEQGDWIAIVPAHDDIGNAGNPGMGSIGQALTMALYAQCVRASRVLQAAKFRASRENDPFTVRKAAFRDSLETSELAEVKAAFAEISQRYKAPEVKDSLRRVKTDHIRTAGRAFATEWFKLTPAAIRSRASIEILCYEQMYAPFSYKAVANRELSIVRVLRTAQLRACAIRHITKDTARFHVKNGAQISVGTKARLAIGEKYDLDLWGCFNLALYGGCNPAELYGEFENLTDLFDLAAWFGYYARDDIDEIPPEIANYLLKFLSARQTVSKEHDAESDLGKIYLEVAYLIKLLFGTKVLITAARRAVSLRKPVKVKPLFYHIVTTPTGVAPDHPNATVDPRFKIGISNNGLRLSADGKKLPKLDKGEKLSLQRFRPLLW
jgi:hypothetical protein